MYTIFISYKYEDLKYLNKIKKWEIKKRLGNQIKILFEQSDVRNKGEPAIKKYLHPMLEKMSILLVLVGEDSHNRFWMDYEIDFAINRKKRIIGMRIPETTGGSPPKINDFELLAFHPDALRKKLREIFNDKDI
jgi:hypothetical protein